MSNLDAVDKAMVRGVAISTDKLRLKLRTIIKEAGLLVDTLDAIELSDDSIKESDNNIPTRLEVAE